MTWPALLQLHPNAKSRLSKRQRIDRIVRRAVRRALCECSETRPVQVSARAVASLA
jgi:hypothetical protein